MGVRATVLATVVAAALCLPMAGVAVAQQDRNCSDFPTQTAAQNEFNKNTTDPYNLDADNDNLACEWLPNERYEDGSVPGTTTPTRGVETGAGGTADLVAAAAEDTAGDDSGSMLPLVVGGAALAAGGLVLARRRSVRKGD